MENNPGISYGLCKVLKDLVDVRPPFRPILSATGTPTYKLGKHLAHRLASITTNEFLVKYFFRFAKEIVNQNSNFFMSSLDVDSLFSNIIPEKTLKICWETLLKKQMFMRVAINVKLKLSSLW